MKYFLLILNLFNFSIFTQEINEQYIQQLIETGQLKTEAEVSKFHLTLDDGFINFRKPDKSLIRSKVKKGTICTYIGYLKDSEFIYKCGDKIGYFEGDLNLLAGKTISYINSNRKSIFLFYEFENKILTWFNKKTKERLSYYCFEHYKNTVDNESSFKFWIGGAGKDYTILDLTYCGNDGTPRMSFNKITKLGKNKYKLIDPYDKSELIIFRRGKTLRVNYQEKLKSELGSPIKNGIYKIIVTDPQGDCEECD